MRFKQISIHYLHKLRHSSQIGGKKTVDVAS